MVGAFVYSILVLLVIAIFSTTGFHSNIHKRMTRAEKLMVFGSEDSVPEYEVFPMSLSRTRRSVKWDKKIQLKLILNGKKIVLNFKPTAGYLATKYTPVWYARSDKYAYHNIRYDPLPTVMRNIGKFKMYHDVENDAAITVYTDPKEKTIIEGVVTPHFAIRSLPKRLMKTTLKIGHYIVETSHLKKRSMNSEVDKDTGYVVLFKIPAAQKNVHRNELHREEDAKYFRQRGIRKQVVPKVVYPEMLIVLDYNAIRNHTIIQAVRFTLAFWNAVDLIYSVLKNPKVHLNIAGIIIAADELATPYIADNTTVTVFDNMDKKGADVTRYFSSEEFRLPTKRYDMIVGMTTARMCMEKLDPCNEIVGIGDTAGACSANPLNFLKGIRTLKGSAFIRYNWKFSGVVTASHETGHLFGAKHDKGTGMTADCAPQDHYVMSPMDDEDSFKWSNCSKKFLKNYFFTMMSECLDNKPRWSRPVSKILPGRWMSMDGQCQNAGYEKSCKLKKISICVELGCQDTQSTCIRTGRVPLPGSKCGRNKYCSSKTKCVRQ